MSWASTREGAGACFPFLKEVEHHIVCPLFQIHITKIVGTCLTSQLAIADSMKWNTKMSSNSFVGTVFRALKWAPVPCYQGFAIRALLRSVQDHVPTPVDTLDRCDKINY